MDKEQERIYCQGLADSFMQGGESTFDFDEEFDGARENLASLLVRARAEVETIVIERVRLAVLNTLLLHNGPGCAFTLLYKDISTKDFGAKQ